MRILAIDIGKYMGLYDGITTHTEFLGDKPKGFGSAAYRPERFAKFLAFLDGYLACREPEVVFYECPFDRGQDAKRSGWGYAGIIEALATKHGAAVLSVHNATLRKWATGTGTKQGSKQPMIDKAKELTGLELGEHEADAVCIWYYANEVMEVVPNGS